MKIKGVITNKNEIGEKYRVWVDGKELSVKSCEGHELAPSQEFCWGYSGSGPTTLALAILLEAQRSLRGVSQAEAQAYCIWFRDEILAKLNKDKDFEREIDMVDWFAWNMEQRAKMIRASNKKGVKIVKDYTPDGKERWKMQK